MKTWHRSAILNQGAGGGGGGVVNENLIIWDVSTNNSADIPVAAGDVLYAVTAFRLSGTATASAPDTNLTNQTATQWDAVEASVRFDTGGVSDGAMAVWKLEIDAAETLNVGDFSACIVVQDVGGQYAVLTGNTDVNAAQGGTGPMSVTCAAADYATADYVLFMCGYNDDTRTSGIDQNTAADFTLPSEILDFDACGTTANSYDEDVFAGYAAAPAEDTTYNFVHANQATMFAAGGWRVYAFALVPV